MCVQKRMILGYIKHINKISPIQNQEEDHHKDRLISSKRKLAFPSWLQRDMRSIEVDEDKIVSEAQGVDMIWAIKSSKSLTNLSYTVSLTTSIFTTFLRLLKSVGTGTNFLMPNLSFFKLAKFVFIAKLGVSTCVTYLNPFFLHNLKDQL